MIEEVKHRPGCTGPTELRTGVNAPGYGIERCVTCGAVRTLTVREAYAVDRSRQTGGDRR